MTYQTEFPDFPPADMPPIPAGWVDISWRNEANPSFSATPDALSGTGIFVHVGYVDGREFPESERAQCSRFGAYLLDLSGCRAREFECDVWDEILAVVAEWRPEWDALVASQDEDDEAEEPVAYALTDAQWLAVQQALEIAAKANPAEAALYVDTLDALQDKIRG